MLLRSAPLLAVLALPLAAQAGTAVGESIWDQQNAIDRATQTIPAGAQITATNCDSVEVGTGNYHYICRVTYTDPPAPSP